MWRLWTAGWGPRACLAWLKHEGFPMWVAWHLPRRIALWTFIRVYAADGQAPGPEYKRVYDYWEANKPARPAQLPAPDSGQMAAGQGSAPSAVHDRQAELDAVRAARDHFEPDDNDLADPRFDAIWEIVKSWDVPYLDDGSIRSGATGNDVVRLLRALDLAERVARA